MDTLSAAGGATPPAEVQIQTEVITSEVVLGLTPQQIIGGDPDRLEVIIVNNGIDDAYVSTGTDVSVTKGIRIASNGGTLILQKPFDHALTTWGLYSVAAAGAPSLFVMIVRRYRR